MKSILSASWLLTIAIGNLLIVIVTQSKFVENQVYEYILFAGLLFIATISFIIISYFYKYVEDIEVKDLEIFIDNENIVKSDLTIDRIDNKLAHIKSNCKICCHHCNVSKK